MQNPERYCPFQVQPDALQGHFILTAARHKASQNLTILTCVWRQLHSVRLLLT